LIDRKYFAESARQISGLPVLEDAVDVACDARYRSGRSSPKKTTPLAVTKVRSEKIAGWKCLVDLSHDRPDQFHKILKKEPTVGRSLLVVWTADRAQAVFKAFFLVCVDRAGSKTKDPHDAQKIDPASRAARRETPTCQCVNHPDQVVAVRRIATPILNRRDGTCLIDSNSGGYPVKALCTLVFVPFLFVASAQTSETWIPYYYLDDADCFGEMYQQGTIPSQIMGMEQFCAAMLSDADGVAITDPENAQDISVGSVRPNEENSPVKYSSRGDDKLAVDGTIEQSTMPTQTIVTKLTIEVLSEAKPDEADATTTSDPEDAKGISVEAVKPSGENSRVKYSAGKDDELALDETTEQSAMSTQIIATKPAIEYVDAKVSETDDVTTTGPNYSEDVQVGAIQGRDGSPIAAYSNHASTMDDSIE
jgi:hypothetical protein